MAIAGGAAAYAYRGTARGRAGLLIAATGASVAAIFFAFLQPHAAANPNWSPVRFYAWTAADVAALFPRGILERAGFLLIVFVPLLFLPFRSRVLWLAAAPFAEVLFSRMSTTYTNGSHYAGAWLGYVLAAFAFAVREMPVAPQRILVACLVLCALETAVADPLHPALNLRGAQARDVALDRFLATLPPNISIATQEEAYTHLALADPNARLFPETAGAPLDACYALVDRAYPRSARLEEYGPTFDALVSAGEYRLERRSDSIELYHRTGACR
jgi:hypothetical protein